MGGELSRAPTINGMVALVALVFCILLLPMAFAPLPAPRERPNPAPSGTSGVAGSTSLGAPSATGSMGYVLGVTSEPRTSGNGAPIPRPSGGIGQPASYCRQFCDSPEPRVVVSKGSGGWATYYGSSEGWTGAINYRLGHVGQVAVVCGGEPFHCRDIAIVDVCACGDRSGSPTLIDLSPFAFRDFAPLSRGVVRISMEVLP